MAAEIPFGLTVTATPPGTPGIGASLAGLGTATKVFILSHPVSLAAVGGFLLGAGVYYALTRKGGKGGATDEVPIAEPAAA